MQMICMAPEKFSFHAIADEEAWTHEGCRMVCAARAYMYPLGSNQLWRVLIAGGYGQMFTLWGFE